MHDLWCNKPIPKGFECNIAEIGDIDIYRNNSLYIINGKSDTSIHNLVQNIHDNLSYYKVNATEIITYYQLEYELMLIEYCENRGYIISQEYKKYINGYFNDLLDYLLRNLINSIEVWKLRELYYFYRSLDACNICCIDDCTIEDHWFDSNSDECCNCNHMCQYFSDDKIEEFIKLVYSQDYSLFDSDYKTISYEAQNNNDGYGSTSLITYFNMCEAYNSSFKMSKQAQFNVLLNLAHNNGTMASKFIYHENYVCCNELLSDLSYGDDYYKDVRIEFSKLNNIPLQELNKLMGVKYVKES